MSSNKSTETQERTALSPQRRPGQERVAALLEAAAAVIAEKGYDGTTMAEVAARGKDPYTAVNEILAKAGLGNSR